MKLTLKEGSTDVGEKIRVLASFSPENIDIHFFAWKDRTYKVESMNLFHVERDSKKKLYNFAVTAKDNSYQLTFDPATLDWQLINVISA